TMLAQFAASVTALLSGQVTAQQAPARRRGRPPKAASVAPPAPVARQLSERAQQAATLVARAGRLTINDLAEPDGYQPEPGTSLGLGSGYGWVCRSGYATRPQRARRHGAIRAQPRFLSGLLIGQPRKHRPAVGRPRAVFVSSG